MTNKEAFKQAKDLIPGGVNSPVRAFGSVGSQPLFIDRGEGAYIYDIEGQRYLDFVQSWGPLLFGHADKDVLNAVIEQAKKGLSFGAPTLIESELASLVLERFKFLDMIRFVSSGTEATMSAIRVARGFSGKMGLIKFEGNYHGHSDSLLIKAGSGATTYGNASSAGVSQNAVADTYLARYNDIDSVRAIFEANADKIGAIIVEPIAGNMGLVPASAEFIRGLRALCDEFKAVLIFDEVMSGFRASEIGAIKYYDICPDMVVFGKVIGGGMAAAAFAARSEIMSVLSPLGAVYQAGTLSGNPVAMAAGVAMLKKIDANIGLYEGLQSLAERLMQGFKDAARAANVKIQTCVRGSMFGYFFTDKEVQNYDDALSSDTAMFARFHNAMLARGVYLAPSQFEAGFICASMSEYDIDFAISAARDAMAEVANG
ncbi:glutamate-1-semialdehyde 2,1-aminomutase [Campylobacter sp. 19-13652]|uniref:glutamate-1-semialdehyde 2,1-aminomutase n=1 Tax=Campylobacter sp. 19-13652 TaxID=2840180 RepID=UPI001C746DC9|nr:glutamate-1-semialdehyde 2,1-aminomutase [Campylobacter sp. 19-13652]BCX79108.1 glutamate-1-semialdehyde 2,1-aminomutase [Campylobacter sp. 19-13652]